VFEHIPDPLGTLRLLHRSLKDGGLVAFNVPNGGGIPGRLRRGDRPAAKEFSDSFNSVAPLEHINCFSHASLLAMARRAGFQRLKLPLRLQYHSLVLGTGPKRVAKDLLRPLYFALGPTTNVLLRRI
jgi:hypothetical protein